MTSALRHAVRRLARTPSFTLSALAALALGIGGNAAVFSAVYAALLRPFPYPEAERLYMVHEAVPLAAVPSTQTAKPPDGAAIVRITGQATLMKLPE